MIQRISEPVSVVSSYNAQTKAVRPISLEWSRRTYPIIQVGLRHTYRQGITRHHVFSVVSNNIFFRLNLNADNLSWTLEEVSDGQPD
jgi:hypothetical protein